jgi:competence protein ComEC
LLFAISLIAVILFRGLNLHRWVFLAFVVFLLGMARLQVAQPEFGPDHLSHYNDLGTRLTITGTIIDDPDVRDTYVGLRMDSERLWIRELQIYKRVEGRLLLYAPRNKTWSYGDRIRVHGYVETPPNFDTFSYREYLARQGIHSIIPDPKIIFIRSNAANPLLKIIYDFRQHARKTIRKLFPDPEASLLEGILIGIESGISPEVRETFNRTGTTHIIAISGFKRLVVDMLIKGERCGPVSLSVNCLSSLRQVPLLSWWAIINGLFDRLVNLFGREKNNGLDLDRAAGVDY